MRIGRAWFLITKEKQRGRQAAAKTTRYDTADRSGRRIIRIRPEAIVCRYERLSVSR